MKKPSTGNDNQDLLIMGGLLLVTLVAFALSFTHMHDWTMANMPRGTSTWAGWGNAVISELIPITAWLAIMKYRKRKKSVVYPVCLFIGGIMLSISAQIGAAGPDASPTRKFLMTLPAIASLALSKFLLTPPGDLKKEDMPPAPSLVPPPPLVIPQSPLASVPPAVPQDTEPDKPPVSPWTTPPGTPLPQDRVPRDSAANVPAQGAGGQGDNQQATATVPPRVSPSAGGEDMGGQDLPGDQDTAATSPTLSGGHDPRDNGEVDAGAEVDIDPADSSSSGLSPRDIQMWEDSQNGLTKKDIAAKHGISEKTVQRSLGKAREFYQFATSGTD